MCETSRLTLTGIVQGEMGPVETGRSKKLGTGLRMTCPKREEMISSAKSVQQGFDTQINLLQQAR